MGSNTMDTKESDYYRDLVDRLLDRLIEEWHSGKGNSRPLHEYCNLTWEEYSKWIQGIL